MTKNPTALISAAVAAVIALAVAFGLPLSDQQAVALLGVIAPVIALIQGGITWQASTSDGQIVATATPGAPEAVAGKASVYPNGTPLATVPATVDPSVQAELLAGVVKPSELKV